MAAISAVWSRKFNNFALLNSAYITLLPKKDAAASIRDYRPISLVHSFAKLLTRLMANRLAGRLDQMITPKTKPERFHQRTLHSGQFHASATHNEISTPTKASMYSPKTRYHQSI